MSSSIKRALLVGINYRNSECELGGCINDVLSIKDLLISKYGYEEKNILLLTDDTNNKPTHNNIIEGWRWLLSKSRVSRFDKKLNGSDTDYKPFRSSDSPTLFFHYSGHGGSIIDVDGDEADGLDETICPIDYETNGMITDDTIREELAVKVPKNGKLFCIIDACHSGTALDLLWTVKPGFFGSFNLYKTGSYVPTQGDVAMISGCRDEQTSADICINGGRNGALTYAILEVLKKSDYDITYDNLLIDVRNYIKENNLSDQIPCMSFGKHADISRKFSL